MKEKFINSMYFRNNLIALDHIQVKEEYDKNFSEPFKVFVQRYKDTKELDEDFFSLSKTLNNEIIEILHLYRFDGKRTEEDINTINSIIRDLNTEKIISETDREYIREDYKQKEEKSRKVFAGDSISALLNIMWMVGNDILLYDTIEEDGSLEELSEKANDEELNTPMFLIQGLYYYLDQCPELFEEERFKNKSRKLLDSVSPNRKEKRHIKRIKKQIKEIH